MLTTARSCTPTLKFLTHIKICNAQNEKGLSIRGLDSLHTATLPAYDSSLKFQPLTVIYHFGL